MFDLEIIKSWANTEGNVNTTNDLIGWVNELNQNTYVHIEECSINDGNMWFYDDYNGEVLNRKRSFFSIKGMRYFVNNHFVLEQPIIVQPEIGYLGIICKMMDGVLNFLMQAKIEPGNINCVQISPTIQATKSNFTRAHGGNLPKYFEYFENSHKYTVLYDQIQSEQAARFLKKRNRNMIMLVDEDIEVYPNYKWMTLGQIKALMEIDNLVNMDTRTVLSGLPFALGNYTNEEKETIEALFKDKALYKSMYESDPTEVIPKIFQLINNYKMFQETKIVPIPLNELVDWEIDQYGITSKKVSNFQVRYYDIEISGREVRKWTQPLFKAIGMATFGLITKVVAGKRLFLVRIKPEIGSFDKIEIGPTIQWESTHYLYNDDVVEKVFRKAIELNEGILNKVVLSEEGGRFYHEQNNNIIIDINDDAITDLPPDYVWVDYCTLSFLVQVNNCLNIQLRNLLSLLKI
ncbi:MAG: NDP-hexose 2,3-dehydratase family protein [Lachnospiraceae bacterium]|nr:NDP-hexose 2,3-dehydratase family protein [Lachnospiraceae bacterium]